MTALQIHGLRKRFAGGPWVLADVELCLEPGQLVIVSGPNGAGKSTLLACTVGLVIPDAGTISIGGHDLAAEPLAARACLRYLPQEPEIPAGITGREILAFLADAYGARGELDAAVGATGLGEQIDHLASTYSVGMRKRLLLGGSWLGDARLYVFDEPFAALDRAGRQAVLDELQRRRTRGAAFLISAHDDEDELVRRADLRVQLG